MTRVLVLVDAPSAQAHTADVGVRDLSSRDLRLLAVAEGLGVPEPVVVGGPPPCFEVLVPAVTTVLHAADVDPDDAAVVASVLGDIVQSADPGTPPIVVLAGDGRGREVAGRLGAACGAGVVADVVAARIESDGVLARTRALGVTWDVDVAVERRPVVLVVADGGPAARPRLHAPDVQPQVVPVAVTQAPRAPRLLARRMKNDAGQRDIGDATVIVAAGRGTGGDLSAVQDLADLLGGAVGVTRAVVEGGWADREAQIGLTGRQVSPRLYVAAGISGAIQHRSGMQESETIVAVNTDPEAPIFEVADIGVVGDLFTVLPGLADEIRRRRTAR